MNRGAKISLSRDVIAARALELTARSGLSKLTMRGLGAEFGVEAMSLYHYVENKSDLLVAMSDQLYDSIKLPSIGPDIEWEPAVRAALRSYYRVLVDNPGALELLLSQPSTSSSGMRVISWSFELLRSVGLPSRQALDALHFVVSFVSGHVATEMSSAPSIMAVAPTVLESMAGSEDGALYEQLSSVEPDDLFEAGLDMAILGLRARFGLD